jgi:hypothetical protein
MREQDDGRPCNDVFTLNHYCSGLAGGAGRAPAGAQRADPLSLMAAPEHPWAAPRQDPRGCPQRVVIQRAMHVTY